MRCHPHNAGMVWGAMFRRHRPSTGVSTRCPPGPYAHPHPLTWRCWRCWLSLVRIPVPTCDCYCHHLPPMRCAVHVLLQGCDQFEERSKECWQLLLAALILGPRSPATALPICWLICWRKYGVGQPSHTPVGRMAWLQPLVSSGKQVRLFPSEYSAESITFEFENYSLTGGHSPTWPPGRSTPQAPK